MCSSVLFSFFFGALDRLWLVVETLNKYLNLCPWKGIDIFASVNKIVLKE